MNTSSQPYSYSSKVPRELKMFTEMISDVFVIFDDVKWSKYSETEIGFYYTDKKLKCEFFFGIWYDLWEQFEIPLCLTFDFYRHAPFQWYDKLRKYISEKNIPGLRLENFEGFTCVLFEYEYFKFDKGDDIVSLSLLYEDLTEYGCIISKI